MRVLLVVSCVAVCSGAGAWPAAAQGRSAFIGAVIDLAGAQEGGHGDEGPQIVAALDAMERALTDWDREIREVEARVRAAHDDGTPERLAQMLAALGLMYYARGRDAEALEAMDRSIAVDARHAGPHLLRGLILRDRGDATRALRSIRQAWDLDAQDPQTSYWLARVAHDAGAGDDSASRAMQALSAAYRRVAAPGAAPSRPILDRALVRDDAVQVPLFPLARYEEGFALLVAGDYARAIGRLRAAAAADPLVSDPALRSDPVTMGIARLKAGAAAEAIGMLERAAEATPDSSDVRRVLAIAYRAAGRIDDSVARLEEALALDPRNERAWIELVSVLEASDAPSRMRQALEEGLDAVPTSGALHWMAAVLSRRLLDEAEATRHLQAVPVASVLAGKSRIHTSLGELLITLKRVPDAMHVFHNAVAAAPNDVVAHVHLGDLYRTEGHFVPALAAFVAALHVAPDVVEAHTGVGQIQLTEGRFEEAVAAFRRAVELRPDHADAQWGLASALLRLGRTGEAQVHLDLFHELDTARIAQQQQQYALWAMKREAAIAEDEGRFDDAAALWETIAAREPGDVENYRALAEALVRAGQVERGIHYLERAVAEHADRQLYRRLAELYAAQGQPQSSEWAREEYQRRLADAFQRTLD